MLNVVKKLLVTALLAGCMVSAHASITWHFVTPVSGDEPEGTQWATLTIVNLGSDEVEFTLTHNDTSVEPQFISDLWLNLATIPIDLSAEFDAPISSITWEEDGIPNTGNLWDVNVDFFTSQGNRLDVGDSVTWTMSGTGLDETDFNVFSTANGENAPALGMIHLQGFNNGGSAKITIDESFPQVPEPASLAALGIGASLLLRRRRKK